MENEFEAKEEIITLLDNSPLSQDQMNLAIKELIHYYNIENYIVKQLNSDVDVLDNKLDSAYEKIGELEFGIKVIEDNLDAAQEEIEELSLEIKTLELGVLSRANQVIDVVSQNCLLLEEGDKLMKSLTNASNHISRVAYLYDTPEVQVDYILKPYLEALKQWDEFKNSINGK